MSKNINYKDAGVNRKLRSESKKSLTLLEKTYAFLKKIVR